MKDIIFRELQDKVGSNKSTLSYIENIYGNIPYPKSYLEFIKKHNGGDAEWYDLDIEYVVDGYKCINKTLPLCYFYSLDDFYKNDSSFGALYVMNEIFPIEIPPLSIEDFIPISKSNSPAYFLFNFKDLNKQGEPTVYLKDYEGFNSEIDLVKISDSFEEFIDSLALNYQYFAELYDGSYNEIKHILKPEEISQIDLMRKHSIKERNIGL